MSSPNCHLFDSAAVNSPSIPPAADEENNQIQELEEKLYEVQQVSSTMEELNRKLTHDVLVGQSD